MKNEYTAPEVIEIGAAQEAILGPKVENGTDDIQQFPLSSLDLDE